MDVLERVGSSRMMLDGKFPYPSAVDCMRYAVQEMAEYDDAMMRQEQPTHKRNNGREHDPRKELGQAGYMILSAMLYYQGYDLTDPEPIASGDPIELWSMIVQNVGSAINFARFNMPDDAAIDVRYAWKQCQQLMRLHGWDVAELIEDTCADFERKHLEPVGPDMRHGGKTA